MPYYAGRMLASKIAYYARNYAGRIYPSLVVIRSAERNVPIPLRETTAPGGGGEGYSGFQVTGMSEGYFWV